MGFEQPGREGSLQILSAGTCDARQAWCGIVEDTEIQQSNLFRIFLNNCLFDIQGMAFSLAERQYFGIHGLLPPAFMTEEQQVYRVMKRLRQQPNDLARYIQLDELQVNKLAYNFFINLII